MALTLHKNGILRVRPLEGGIEAWRERDFPVEAQSAETQAAEPPGSPAFE